MSHKRSEVGVRAEHRNDDLTGSEAEGKGAIELSPGPSQSETDRADTSPELHSSMWFDLRRFDRVPERSSDGAGTASRVRSIHVA